MKILILSIVLALLFPFAAEAQLIFPNRGGTGTTTVPSTGQVLLGQANGTYGPVSTSSLGFDGLATSSINTEAKLESILSDVANVFTDNDGTLNDDDLSNNSTSDLSEGANLYYTVARVQTALLAGYNGILGNSTTTNSTSTNLAVTGSFNLLGTVITNVAAWFSNLFDSNFTTKDTGDLAEGSNLYFTDARARGAISETVTGLDYSSATGVLSGTSGFSIPTTASSTDWQTAFSWGDHSLPGYLTAVSTSTVRGMFSASSPISYNSGSGVFSVASGYTIPLTASTSEWATTRNIVTASSSLWDEAYSWGDHSLAGYLTGNQTITLSGDVSGTGTTSITTTVANDSHAHTSLTLSGVDISDDTNLSVSATGLELSADAIALTTGYVIPLSASTTEWSTAYASTTALTPSYIRGLFSNTATGLTYTSGTGATSLTAGYNVPLTASTTEWHNFHTTPSGRITAGTGIDWSGNTLNGVYTAGDALTLTGEDFNFDGGSTPSGDLGGTWALPSVTDDSHAHTGTTLSSIDVSGDTNLTVTATGLELSADAIALTTGYVIPLTASTTNWNTFYDTPSNRITAGTGLTWTGNTLDADNNGTVTSVDITVPTGLSISGNPITTSGTLALALSAGYNIPLTASTTQWAAAHASTTALTPAYFRGLFSGTSPVSYNSGTGAFGITADAIGDTELAFNTGQHLTTTSAPTFASSTFTNLTSALLQTTAGGLLSEYAGAACTNQFVRSLSALGAATCAAVSLTSDVTGILPIANGGLATSTAPLQGQVPLGNAAGSYDLVATSSLGITASAGGSNTQLQYNSGGALAGLSTLTTDGSSLTMTGVSSLATTTIAGDFGVNTNDLVVTNSNGYVGVGTTTPEYPYHQEADINNTSGSHYGQLNTVFTNPSGTSSASLFASRDEIQTASGNAFNYNVLIANAPRVFHNGPGSVFDMRGNNLVASNRSTGAVTTGTGGYFALSNTGGGSYGTGRAGYFNFNNSNGTVSNGYGLWADYTNGTTATTTNTYGVYIGDVTSGVQTNQAYGLYQVDAGARNYFAGNVGIGTVSPGTKLSVVPGIAYVAPTLGTASGAFSMLGDDGLYGLYSGVSNTGNSWLQAMRNDTTATAYDILLNPSGGDVGIGTTTPGARLVAQGVSSGTILDLVSDAGTRFLSMLNTGVTTLLGTWDFSAATVKQDTYKSFTWPGTATTTTATTTIPLGTAYTAESWNTVDCWVTSGTGPFNFSDGTNKTNGATATTTVARTTLSTNKTFTAQERRYLEVGPLTAAMISCTAEVTVNN